MVISENCPCKKKSANITGNVMFAKNTMLNPSVKDLVNERKKSKSIAETEKALTQ